MIWSTIKIYFWMLYTKIPQFKSHGFFFLFLIGALLGKKEEEDSFKIMIKLLMYSLLLWDSSKICVYSTFFRPYLWNFTEYIIIVVVIIFFQNIFVKLHYVLLLRLMLQLSIIISCQFFVASAFMTIPNS